MAEPRLMDVLQRLRGFARSGASDANDADLLGRFVARREEAAFEALVRRHGPMIWGVCRRVLRDPHDAEDAFQATFLVLVRKAASIARRELLSAWLYGVAYRTALEARVAAARRRVKEREAGAMPRNETSEPEALRDALRLLDQELTRLPDRLRTPIVLCDLHGKSRRDAARQLHLPEGTLSSRLARGRVLLARRLARHGLAVSGGALAGALAADAASAGMPPLLTGSTVHTALIYTTGQAAGAASAKVLALTEGVLKTMLLSKLKIATAMLLAVGLIAAGAMATVLRPEQARAAETGKPAARVLAAAPSGEKEPAPNPDKKPGIEDGDNDAAVARGLKWLALHQAPDGHWSLDEFQKYAHKEPSPDSKTFVDECTGQATTKNDVAATAFGVLPFLAAGCTHKAPHARDAMDYHKTVKAALDWLVAKQDKNGAFDAASMYANALAAWVLCDAYGMTSDPALKGPAQKGVNYIVASQDPNGGGWRYTPKMPGDLSVTGWQVAALKSGQLAGLDVDKTAVKKAKDFLESCQTKTKGYSYLPDSPETASMTAVGMLSWLRLGGSPRNPGLLAGVDVLKASPPGKTGNIYYEFYASEAMFDLGGDAWDFWKDGPGGKNGIREALLANQEKSADTNSKATCLEGSWAPQGAWKDAGGRIMQTSLSLLVLEMSYRRLPLYRKDAPAPKEKE